MPHLRRSALVAMLVVGALCSGCADYSTMQFFKDERLTFTTPDDYEEVEVPLVVSWTMEDFEILARGEDGEIAEDVGYFGVFVDRAPVKPGKTLADVGKGDTQCEIDPRCPDKTYLNAKGVYTTRQTSITLDYVAPLSSKERIQLHQVTVVLLDAEGKRIGEYAWYQRFKLENLVVNL
ncbi:MAG: hypothetical protein WB767_09530 [Nocardioides sp.]